MNYYNEIKDILINNEVTKRVKDYSKNKSDLDSYYKVGKLLSEAGKHYGESIIKNFSIKLTNELGKGYSERNLKHMRNFYLLVQKRQTLSAELTWSHYVELLKFNDINIINYYVNICIIQNLSVRELRDKVKSNEYERLDENTKLKLINNQEKSITDFVKNPIIVNNKYNYENISEKILKKLILEDMEKFLCELGSGFCFIKSEHKIKIGDRYNYIDILLYNINYNCYVVVELKVTELKKEHIGQVMTYMNYIDKNLKKYNQDKTIGIIISRKDNKFIIEYSSDPKIFSTTYIIN